MCSKYASDRSHAKPEFEAMPMIAHRNWRSGVVAGLCSQRWLVHSLLLLATFVCGCGMGDLPTESSLVVLLDTEFLDPSAVQTVDSAFRPTCRFRMPNGIEAVIFRLDVAAATDALIVEFGASAGGLSTRLTEVRAPQALVACDSYGSSQADALKDRPGVFWVQPGLAPQSWRVTVALDAAAMSPFNTLTIAARSLGHTAIGGLKVELVDGFFYLVVIGDSIQAGNGLREEHKISSLVAAEIESRLKKRVVVQRYAHSGATIRTRETDGYCRYNCWGEVPRVTTSIPDQANLVQHPELIDLVILDGCINDVGVSTIIDADVAPTDLATMTKAACGEPMINLLRHARAVMPNARIVVTGYYQIVADSTDVEHLVVWADTLGLDLSKLVDDYLPKVIQNSKAFLESAHHSIRQAVVTVAAEDEPGAGIVFVDPGFDEQNALFTPTSWLWGLSEDRELLSKLSLDVPLFPLDETLAISRDRCLQLDQPIGNLISCIYRSVGHPTPDGARAYSNSIIDRLRELSVF